MHVLLSALWCVPCCVSQVEDILEFILFVTRYSPATLSRASASLEPLMTFVVFMLAHPTLLNSPHLCAKFGDVLFSGRVFLECHEWTAEVF